MNFLDRIQEKRHNPEEKWIRDKVVRLRYIEGLTFEDLPEEMKEEVRDLVKEAKKWIGYNIYHGTTESAIPSIKREGLRTAYVTRLEHFARFWARARAEERQSPPVVVTLRLSPQETVEVVEEGGWAPKIPPERIVSVERV